MSLYDTVTDDELVSAANEAEREYYAPIVEDISFDEPIFEQQVKDFNLQ